MFRTLSLLLLATPALAQEEAGEVDPLTGRTIVYEEVTELEFGELDVDATLLKPTIGFIVETEAAEHTSMLRMRTDFSKEMTASIDDVK